MPPCTYAINIKNHCGSVINSVSISILLIATSELENSYLLKQV